MNRNELSACGDSTKATPSRAQDHELDSSELTSLASGLKSIANEVVNSAPPRSRVRRHALLIDGHEACALQVVDGSKAAQYLDKDPKAFGAGVKRLFLAGSAGGEKLREILDAPPPEKMDAEASPRARGGLLGGYAAVFGGGSADLT